MKLFERFITYLTIVAVGFAAFYAVLPGLAGTVFERYGAFFGPVILVLVFVVAWRRKPSDKSPDKPQEKK